MAEKEKSTPKTKVKVRVVKQPLNEDGITYVKGDTFDIDADRAAELGELVVLVTA